MSLPGRIWSATWRILLFFTLWGLLLAPIYLGLGAAREAAEAGPSPAERLWLELLAALAVLAAGWLMVRLVDRRSFASLGFVATGMIRDLLSGLLLGAAMIALAAAVLGVAGWARIASPAGFSWPVLGLLGGALLCNSVTQEVLVRGYLLQAIDARFTTSTALVVSSVVFTAMHAGAIVEGGLLPAINLFAAGLLLGLAYTTTRNLWLPIALHFSWNFLQGPVLGIAVSGQALDGGWRLLELQGPALLTGGRFGLEGGLVGTLATVTGIAALVVLGRSGRAYS